MGTVITGNVVACLLNKEMKNIEIQESPFSEWLVMSLAWIIVSPNHRKRQLNLFYSLCLPRT